MKLIEATEALGWGEPVRIKVEDWSTHITLVLESGDQALALHDLHRDTLATLMIGQPLELAVLLELAVDAGLCELIRVVIDGGEQSIALLVMLETLDLDLALAAYYMLGI